MGLLPFALNDFKGSFTLFPKCFSSFVHTTCSLSVLVLYLAFAEIHLRLCTALSNCATLGSVSRIHRNSRASRHTRLKVLRDVRPPWWHFPERFVCLRVPSPRPSLHYNSTASGSFGCGFKLRLFPVHSPLLRESRLFSCPPLNDMLKFSGFSCIAEVVCVVSQSRGDDDTPRARFSSSSTSFSSFIRRDGRWKIRGHTFRSEVFPLSCSLFNEEERERDWGRTRENVSFTLACITKIASADPNRLTQSHTHARRHTRTHTPKR